jgi:hypothetical protein
MNDAVNAETGQRGYAATGDPLFLVGLHGDEVLRRLRAKSATAGIAYLAKPLDLTELGQLLDSFIAGHDHEADPAPRTVPAP